MQKLHSGGFQSFLGFYPALFEGCYNILRRAPICMSDLTGKSLGRYQIFEPLGEGGMANVFKAYDTRLERNVAIKVIRTEKADASFLIRFEREAKALAQFTHPNIVHINDYGEQDGVPYLVMDYLPGGTLKKYMGNPLPFRDAARLLAPIAHALEYAHQRKIIHRDIKPANILFSDSEQPMLSDFGIAKLLESDDPAELTSTGMGVGTPAYMAPEQVNKNFDNRVDIYALGVVFYELVTGRKPYEGDTPLATMMKHTTEPLPPPRQFISDLPPAVEQVIYKALAKRPEERFQTMENFAAELEKLAQGILDGRVQAAQPVPSAGRLNGEVYAPSRKASSIKKIIIPLVIVGVLGLLFVAGVAGVMQLVNLSVFSQANGDGGAPALAATQTSQALSMQMTSIANGWATATAVAQSVAAAEKLNTQTAEAVPSPTEPKPTETVVKATETAEMLATTAVPLPSQTAAVGQALPVQQALESSTRIAFLNQNDIWVVSTDGKNLVQVTTSGGAKSNVRWTDSGKALAYISGKCIQKVGFLDSKEETLFCFNFAAKLTGFEFSRDEKYFGVIVDDVLYLGEYNLEKLKDIYYKQALRDYATCGNFSGTKFFLFSADGSRIAVSALAPGEDVIRLQNHLCKSNNQAKLDSFPDTRFRPHEFNKKPQIPSFGWDGRLLFAITTNRSEMGLGYLYIYNNETKAGTQVKPMGTECCYRDPTWTEDGNTLLFAYWPQSDIAHQRLNLYYVPYGSIETGQKFTPIPLPDNLLNNIKEVPQPVIYQPKS